MSTSLEEVRKPEVLPAPVWTNMPSAMEAWLDHAKFAHMQRIAQMFAQSDLVPQHFRGNVANCAIALQMAYRMNIDPMMALQNMYVVHGNPGLSSQLCIALANQSGVFDGPIEFEQAGTGNNLTVTAVARLARSKREVRLAVSFQQAMDAGWPRAKDGIKPFWKAMPEQMLRYRSAVFLIRAYAPDVMMGMHTKEEWEDLGDGVEQRVDQGAEIAARVISKVEKSVAPVVTHEVKNHTEAAPEPTKRGPGRPRKSSVEATTEAPEPSTEEPAEQQQANPPPNPAPAATAQQPSAQADNDSWEV